MADLYLQRGFLYAYIGTVKYFCIHHPEEQRAGYREGLSRLSACSVPWASSSPCGLSTVLPGTTVRSMFLFSENAHKFQYTHFQFLVSGVLSIVLFLYCFSLPQCPLVKKEATQLGGDLGLRFLQALQEP